MLIADKQDNCALEMGDSDAWQVNPNHVTLFAADDVLLINQFVNRDRHPAPPNIWHLRLTPLVIHLRWSSPKHFIRSNSSLGAV